MMGWFRKKTSEPAADEFQGIMVTVKVGGEQSLFIMLGARGIISSKPLSGQARSRREGPANLLDSPPRHDRLSSLERIQFPITM